MSENKSSFFIFLAISNFLRYKLVFFAVNEIPKKIENDLAPEQISFSIFEKFQK